MTRRAAFRATITGPRRWRRRISTRRPTAASRSASPSGWPGGTRSAMRSRLSLLFALLLAAAPAASQQRAPTAYDRAIAAGYKALTLCSAIFNAGRTQAQAEALELTGIYPEYDAIVPTLRAEVRNLPAARAAEVRVRFEDSLAPRIARWHAGEGCTILRIGDPGSGSPGPTLAAGNGPPPAPGNMDARPWPLGDATAIA